MSREAEPSLPGEELGARLRAERETRGWTSRKLAEKLSDASIGLCDVPGVESIVPQIRRWERGGGGIGQRYRTLYCLVFEMGMELFTISPGVASLCGRAACCRRWRRLRSTGAMRIC